MQQALNVPMGRVQSASNWAFPNDRNPGWPAGYGRGTTAETVDKLVQQGQLVEAVEALGALVYMDCRVPKSLFHTVLKECVGDEGLLLGRRVHALSVKSGQESDTFLCNHILRMYASHAKLQEAMDVFTMVAKPDAFMWSSIISAYVKHGEDKQAIQLYQRMRGYTVKPDGHVFVAALQACARGADLHCGQQVHADVLASGIQHNVFVGSCLVDMYAKCGRLKEALKVFYGLSQKNVVTWSAMIAGCAQEGKGEEALHVYRAMQEEGIVTPNSVTFVCLLQACAAVGPSALQEGKQLHSQIREQGLQGDVAVSGSLVNMYAKCGSLECARRIFDGLAEKTVVTWNVMISGYSQEGVGKEALDLYRAMQEEGVATPNSVTFVCLLQACGSLGKLALDEGKKLHAQIKQQELQADIAVGGSLINMYAKCGSLEDARILFDKLELKNVVTWNAMIAGYSQQGMGQEALAVYRAMQEGGMVAPDSVTFVCLLQACALGTLSLEEGKQLHAQIRGRGLQFDVVLGGSLVNMYAKCGSLADARGVFDGLEQKSVVTWGAMIAGYSQKGMGQEALSLYRAMQTEGMAVADSVIFVSLLQACANLGTPALEKGMELHAQIRERGLHADIAVGGSLVNMYAKCGSLRNAWGVFDGLGQKNVVTWNAMIAGCSQQGMEQAALSLYKAMLQDGQAVPDSVTFVCLLQACANVGASALEKGKQLHAQIRDQGLDGNAVVGGSLVNMYAKCGSLEDARDVFNGLSQKDAVTWNAIIAGHSQQGLGQYALRFYRDMLQEGEAEPNSVTFMWLLQACASVAALHIGRQLHAQIRERGLEADVLLAGTLIDMYGKCGSMLDAQRVFDALPERDVVAWSVLIAGYTRQGDSDKVFDLIVSMREAGFQPDSITFLNVLTVCSHTGLVNEGREYFEVMSRHYGILPSVEHYTCMVDLLGRLGHLNESLALVRTMPVLPDRAVWSTLLGACQKWSNVELGRQAFDEAIKLDKRDAAAYVLMSNIYTGAQLWEEAQELQARRRGIGAWKQPGQSWWTDIDGLVHSFSVKEKNDPDSEVMLKQALPEVSKESYVPHLEPSFADMCDGTRELQPQGQRDASYPTFSRPNACSFSSAVCGTWTSLFVATANQSQRAADPHLTAIDRRLTNNHAGCTTLTTPSIKETFHVASIDAGLEVRPGIIHMELG